MNNIQELIKSFEKEVKIQHSATLVGDYKTNNRSFKRSHKIFKTLRKLDKVDALLPLLNSEHPEVRLYSANYCLPIAEEQCLKIFEDIKNGDYQILSLSAEYCIKNWTTKEYAMWDI